MLITGELWGDCKHFPSASDRSIKEIKRKQKEKERNRFTAVEEEKGKKRIKIDATTRPD